MDLNPKVKEEVIDFNQKIKEEMNNLPNGYNIIPEADNIDYIASRRLEITKLWIPKLLKMSLYLNIMTMVSLLISIILLLDKPEPKFFGTTPNGKVIPLQAVKLHQTQQGIVIENR